LEHCIHIETIALVDGTYELVPEPMNEQPEAQVDLMEVVKEPDVNPETESEPREAQDNLMELTEVLNQSSEEPKTNDPIEAIKGKLRCIILLFSNYATYYSYLLVHLSS